MVNLTRLWQSKQMTENSVWLPIAAHTQLQSESIFGANTVCSSSARTMQISS